MVKVNDANNVTNGCWPRANLEEAWKTVKKTPEYKDYLKAEDFADEKYKAKAEDALLATPEYKNYEEAKNALLATPAYKAYEETEEELNNGK